MKSLSVDFNKLRIRPSLSDLVAAMGAFLGPLLLPIPPHDKHPSLLPFDKMEEKINMMERKEKGIEE